MNELETNVVCKLTDFGFVKALEKNEKATTILGTANYMAPELVKNQKYDSKVDKIVNWSVHLTQQMVYNPMIQSNGLAK